MMTYDVAPACWGYRPGVPLIFRAEDMPDLPLLRVLSPKQRTRAVVDTLLAHSLVLETITGAELFAKYPALSRQRCYELIEYAKRGGVPKSRARTA